MLKYTKKYCFIVFTVILLLIISVVAELLLLQAFPLPAVIMLICSILLSIILFFTALLPVLSAYRNLQKSGVDEYLARHGGFPDIDTFFNGEWARKISEIDNEYKKTYDQLNTSDQLKFKALQAQINPHFLYNTLDSIRGLAYIEDAEQTAEMTEALSAFCRYNISAKEDIVPLEKELQNLQNYLLIQKYRFADRFNAVFHIDESDSTLTQYRVPKLILQPIVENALFHGLEKKISGGQLCISIEHTQARLYIRISDNGIGMTAQEVDKLYHKMASAQRDAESSNFPTNKEKNNGIAIANINQQIKYIYGEDYGLNFSSTYHEGTEVEFVLPYPQKPEFNHS